MHKDDFNTIKIIFMHQYLISQSIINYECNQFNYLIFSWESLTYKYLHVVKEWSHQSVLHKYAFRSSLVLPTITAGGATSVLIASSTQATPTMTPIRRRSIMSDILTALAERTWKITDILGTKDKGKVRKINQSIELTYQNHCQMIVNTVPT